MKKRFNSPSQQNTTESFCADHCVYFDEMQGPVFIALAHFFGNWAEYLENLFLCELLQHVITQNHQGALNMNPEYLAAF